MAYICVFVFSCANRVMKRGNEAKIGHGGSFWVFLCVRQWWRHKSCLYTWNVCQFLKDLKSIHEFERHKGSHTLVFWFVWRFQKFSQYFIRQKCHVTYHEGMCPAMWPRRKKISSNIVHNYSRLLFMSTVGNPCLYYCRKKPHYRV